MTAIEPLQVARRRRRARGAAVVVTVAVVVGAVVVSSVGLGGGSDRPASGPAAATATTAKIERRTLVQSASIDGRIDFGTPQPLLTAATGTITWLPKEGTTVKRGQTLIRVDDRPVVLLYGALPQYRELAENLPPAEADEPDQPDEPEATSDAGTPAAGTKATPTAGTQATPAPTNDGKAGPTPAATKKAPPPPFTGNDVKQFESNLVALGFRVTVDRAFTTTTTAAVKRWQRSLQEPQDGKVRVGDVVYADGPVRIAKVGGRVGAPMTAEVLSISGKTRYVTANASPTDLSWAKTGAKVAVGLPGGRTTAGVVASVGTPGAEGATGAAGPADPSGDTAVEVKVIVTDKKALAGVDDGPARVTYEAKRRENVLCVPVPALVALVEGGYGLEPATPGTSGFFAVETGMFADGFVEVSGPDLTEGMTLRTPQ